MAKGKKKRNNDIQNIKEKTVDRKTRILLNKNRGNSDAPER
jgi:hypothetical protein